MFDSSRTGRKTQRRLILSALLLSVMAAGCADLLMPEARSGSEKMVLEELSPAQQDQLVKPDQARFWKEYNVSLVPEPRTDNPAPTPPPAVARPARTPASTDLTIKEPAPFVADEDVATIPATMPSAAAQPLPIIAETQPSEEEEGTSSVIRAGGAIGAPTTPGQLQRQPPTPAAGMPGARPDLSRGVAQPRQPFIQPGQPGIQPQPTPVMDMVPTPPPPQPTPMAPAETNYRP